MNEQELDDILNEMRQEEAAPGAERAARERVRSQLSAGPLCLQFRGQFDVYRDGKLGEAPRMLLEDHLTRCPGCRRALQGADVVSLPPPSPARVRRFSVPRWAIAAGVAAVALYFGRNALDRAFAPSGARATVTSASGVLYALQAAPLAAGAEIGDGEVVRTGAGARAHLQLADGSMVEVNERTELSVKAAWSGATIHLDRGDIIVRAAKQRRGYLKVVTQDSEASVKGTIFTVSAGTAGSLVGVVEGSVAVTQPGTARLLQPGEQATTSAALGKVTVRQAVAWSEERENHFALLTELASIEKQLPAQEARTSARLLSKLPPGVVIYVAIPNLGKTMDKAVELIEQRSRDNAALNEWWTSPRAGEMKKLIGDMRHLSPMLGDEVVFLLLDSKMPVAMAEVKPGQEAELTASLDTMLSGRTSYRVANGTMLITNTPEHLAALTGMLGQGANTPFALEIAKRYGRGVAWILGADVMGSGDANALPMLRANQVRYAFAEQRAVEGVEENEATLTFAGARTGVASWLAAPGSLGSAEYASADTVAVFSAATRRPREILEELTELVPGVAAGLREMELKSGVNAVNDLAAALGTDFTLSVETAAVPIPGVIAAVEVYQPATLNATIDRLAEAYNRELTDKQQGRKLTLAQETVDGRVWHSLTMTGFGAHWTFDRGYWIVALDRAVAMRALATRAGGGQLVRSAQFRAQMPTLGGLHPSGFAWFNVGPAAGVLSSLFPSPKYQQFLAIREPSLLTFNGETERIQVASRTRFTSLMLDTMVKMNARRKLER